MEEPVTDEKHCLSGPLIVAVVGVIGAGKSTIIRRLRESEALGQLLRPSYNNWVPKIEFVLEDSSSWRDSGALAEFYSDTDRNAYWFQTLVLDSHVDKLSEAIAKKPDIIIIERSVYCQRIFWEIQVSLGRTNKFEDMAYRGSGLDGKSGIWRKWEKMIPPPAILLHAEADSLDTVMERVQTRAREAEQKGDGVSREYEHLLLNFHDEVYTSPECSPFGDRSIPCVKLNTGNDFITNDDTLQSEIVLPVANAVLQLRRQTRATEARRVRDLSAVCIGKSPVTSGGDSTSDWMWGSQLFPGFATAESTEVK